VAVAQIVRFSVDEIRDERGMRVMKV